MKYSFDSTMRAVQVLAPELAALRSAGHIRMDLDTLLDRVARQYFMDYCGPQSRAPDSSVVRAAHNVHSALTELQKDGSINFGKDMI